MAVVFLHPEDIRNVKWTIPGLPTDASLAVSLDGVTWVPLNREVGTDVFWQWVAGPDSEVAARPAQVVLAPLGRSTVLVRATDTPEVITEEAGYIWVRVD